jgi:RNA polymerase-binding transcription factor DksA
MPVSKSKKAPTGSKAAKSPLKPKASAGKKVAASKPKPSVAAKSPAKSAPSSKAKAKVQAKPKSAKSSKPAKSPKPAAPSKLPATKKSVPPKAKPAKAAPAASSSKAPVKELSKSSPAKPPVKLSPTFLAKQKQRLLHLKDVLLDSMNGVAKDTLRARAEGSEGSAFGMHQADAGSDAYDRDFALSLLSLEQNSLYEIDQALERISEGTYGICEISGKPIPHPRLEALPFTRYTVECQAELEKQNRFRARVPVNSLFGLNDADGEDDDDDSSNDQKD